MRLSEHGAQPKRRRLVVRLVLLFITMALALAGSACGSGGGKGATNTPRLGPATSAETFPVTLITANGSVTIPARPSRVISLSPTATEMLFAIGAGKQVIAVARQRPCLPRVRDHGLHVARLDLDERRRAGRHDEGARGEGRGFGGECRPVRNAGARRNRRRENEGRNCRAHV